MTTLTFQNKTLSVTNHQNQIWLTSVEIGKALDYNNPVKGVTKLYNTHADEFTPNMTALVDMQTAGGIQKVRIFSLRGCHLIGMLSHTKVAKEFRKWVLDILDRETAQPKQLELPKPMPQTVTIPYPGRWLVVTNEFDQNKVIVKNIDGNNCVEAKIHRKIISETHLMADLLMELAKRMRVLDGEASPSRLETPILESKCRTILF